MEKNGEYNFSKLMERVKEGLVDSDREKIHSELKRMTGSTLVSGVGGSSVVAVMASKVLREKNHMLTQVVEPRDMIYQPLDVFSNVLACSYSGNNYGVETSFQNDLKHYLLSSKPKESVHNITYCCNNPEKSFISLAATLVPCSILMDYYCDGKEEEVLEEVYPSFFDFLDTYPVYEIFSGYDTSVSSKYLESTITEAGIGIPIVHDKYSYCHGRSTLGKNYPSTIVYFDTHTELDRLLIEELQKDHDSFVRIDVSKGLKGDFSALVKSMYLTKAIADKKGMDLSGVDYHPIVKKLYKYRGEM